MKAATERRRGALTLYFGRGLIALLIAEHLADVVQVEVSNAPYISTSRDGCQCERFKVETICTLLEAREALGAAHHHAIELDRALIELGLEEPWPDINKVPIGRYI